MALKKTEPTPEYFDYAVEADENKFYSGEYQFIPCENDWVKDMKNIFKEGETVLDIGCGHGKWFEPITKTGAHYHGVDYSKNMIATAGEKNPKGEWTLVNKDYIPNKFYDTIMEIPILYVFPGHAQGFIDKFQSHCNRILLFEPERKISNSYSYDVAQIYQIDKNGMKKLK